MQFDIYWISGGLTVALASSVVFRRKILKVLKALWQPSLAALGDVARSIVVEHLRYGKPLEVIAKEKGITPEMAEIAVSVFSWALKTDALIGYKNTSNGHQYKVLRKTKSKRLQFRKPDDHVRF